MVLIICYRKNESGEASVEDTVVQILEDTDFSTVSVRLTEKFSFVFSNLEYQYQKCVKLYYIQRLNMESFKLCLLFNAPKLIGIRKSNS